MLKKGVYSFKNALEGISWIIRTQVNFKIQLILSFLAVLGGIIFRISYLEFLAIIILIGVGLAIETINTAIEEAIDAIHKDWSNEIKIAKDVSAAAMLIFSLTALAVAIIIFVPKILFLITSNY